MPDDDEEPPKRPKTEAEVLAEWMRRHPQPRTADNTNGSAVSDAGPSRASAQVREARRQTVLQAARHDLEANGYGVRIVRGRATGGYRHDPAADYLCGERDDGAAVAFPLLNLTVADVARNVARALSGGVWPSSIEFYMADVQPITVGITITGLGPSAEVHRVADVPVTPREIAHPFRHRLVIEISSRNQPEDQPKDEGVWDL